MTSDMDCEWARYYYLMANKCYEEGNEGGMWANLFVAVWSVK